MEEGLRVHHCVQGLWKELAEITQGSMEEGLRGVWGKDLGCFVLLRDYV